MRELESTLCATCISLLTVTAIYDYHQDGRQRQCNLTNRVATMKCIKKLNEKSEGDCKLKGDDHYMFTCQWVTTLQQARLGIGGVNYMCNTEINSKHTNFVLRYLELLLATDGASFLDRIICGIFYMLSCTSYS